MTYQKPEVAVLGDASHIIQGGIPKQTSLESDGVTPRFASDCEIDD